MSPQQATAPLLEQRGTTECSTTDGNPRDHAIHHHDFFFLRVDKTVFTTILGRKKNAIRQKGFIFLRCLHKSVERRGSGSIVLSLSAPPSFCLFFQGMQLSGVSMHWQFFGDIHNPLPHSLTRSLVHSLTQGAWFRISFRPLFFILFVLIQTVLSDLSVLLGPLYSCRWLA